MFPLLALCLSADLAQYPPPPPARADEPTITFSKPKAAAYLDAVGVNWTRDRQCVTCHTNLPYLLARPGLGGDDRGWKEVRSFLEGKAARWAAGEKSGVAAYVVATAAGLAATDARAGTLADATKVAFARMWQVQRDDGAWDWLKCDWPPMEHDDYYGAALAAVAVGLAPGEYAKSEDAKPGLTKLRQYLSTTPPPDRHHAAMRLWASLKVDGLLSVDQKKQTVKELIALRKGDGGWSLASLGSYKRRDGSANPADAPSDGYATGFVTFVLKETLGKDHPEVAAGKSWLLANQRASGRWFTRSLTTDKAHYISNAGTAFAVLALE